MENRTMSFNEFAVKTAGLGLHTRELAERFRVKPATINRWKFQTNPPNPVADAIREEWNEMIERIDHLLSMTDKGLDIAEAAGIEEPPILFKRALREEELEGVANFTKNDQQLALLLAILTLEGQNVLIWSQNADGSQTF